MLFNCRFNPWKQHKKNTLSFFLLERAFGKIFLALCRFKWVQNLVVSQISCLTVATSLIIKQLICKNNTFATPPKIYTQNVDNLLTFFYPRFSTTAISSTVRP